VHPASGKFCAFRAISRVSIYYNYGGVGGLPTTIYYRFYFFATETTLHFCSIIAVTPTTLLIYWIILLLSLWDCHWYYFSPEQTASISITIYCYTLLSILNHQLYFPQTCRYPGFFTLIAREHRLLRFSYVFCQFHKTSLWAFGPSCDDVNAPSFVKGRKNKANYTPSRPMLKLNGILNSCGLLFVMM
jgi:hypothetical protein